MRGDQPPQGLDPRRLSATALAQALRDGRLRAQAVVERHLETLVRADRQMHAVVQPLYDAARAAAAEADARLDAARRQGTLSALPPLLGVPCTLKENFAFAGLPQTSGLVARRNAIATTDAPAVARIKASGAIPLCTTNVPELCMWMETHNRLHGRTGNPYDPGRIVGGSSGGEGAVVGAGAAAFGLGADVGGSIRFPAFFNGVFGHKPTPGIVPNTGQYPLPRGQMNHHCVTGPIARRAEDLWPLLRLLAGADGVDPGCHGHLRGDPAGVDLSRLRVVDIAGDGRYPVSASLRQAQARAARWLGERGAGLRRLQPPLLRHAFPIWGAQMAAARPEAFAVQLGQGRRIALRREALRWLTRRSPHTLPALGLAALESLPLPHDRYLRMAETLREALLDAIGDGVLLYPPYTRPAPRHNAPMLTAFHFAYCGLFNVLGFPVTQVPLGLDARGLPLGVQVVAAPGNDSVAIAAAQALESRFGGWVPPWSLRS